VGALYRDFRGEAEGLDLTGGEALEVWDMMGRYCAERKAARRH
jgi:hypothetical protein